MQIRDCLYGDFQLEDVLLDLMNSKPMKRLQGIHQGGASFLVDEKWNVTRYEHSVGVMLFIRKVNGSIEEQIAGLLHDVSHTAFSHVIDFVFDNQQENYHDLIFDEIISSSAIPQILQKHGYSWKAILNNLSKWTILEQPSPLLCADRIDYTLRDMYRYGIVSLDECHRFLQSIVIRDGKIVLTDISAAEWFVETYYKEVIDFFLHPRNAYGNYILSRSLKLAIDKGIITLADFKREDKFILNLLRSSGDNDVLQSIAQMQDQVVKVSSTEAYDIYLKQKTRLIDPLVESDQKINYASTVSPKIKIAFERAKQVSVNGLYLRVM